MKFLVVIALVVLSGGRSWGQNADLPPGGQSVGFGIQILTSTNGLDFTEYARHLAASVKRKWFYLMPEQAIMGEKGIVVVRFSVQKDGTLTSQAPTVEISSKRKVLDTAAVEAVRGAAPFDHLPDAFGGPSIELRLTFYYNVRPDHTPRS